MKFPNTEKKWDGDVGLWRKANDNWEMLWDAKNSSFVEVLP